MATATLTPTPAKPRRVPGRIGRIDRMKALFERALAPTHLQINDRTFDHILDKHQRKVNETGHAPALRPGKPSPMTHFEVEITSERFRGMRPLERHRLVYQLLEEEFGTGLHSITMKLNTPS
ncbi:BolA family transcriptional regulator [Formicincola oecophyllae]|uniref:BolA family transcriptional regulator n=1 Tax=Formicincola oecophyllae TaxID=2558361 RepID=A0A4Y6U6H7_9PROT|nr:BolA family protein [Formicincola oecophyllae]QDH12953.1 BolA family transcriptional regulator [Formicincola oecophyllae]